MKDYYALLGVSSGASQRELRLAWRKLAFEQHPDRHPDNPLEAHARFLEIQEAFAVLIDGVARRGYDRRFRKAFPDRAPPPQAQSRHKASPRGRQGPKVDATEAASGQGAAGRRPLPPFRRQKAVRRLMLELAGGDRSLMRWLLLVRLVGAGFAGGGIGLLWPHLHRKLQGGFPLALVAAGLGVLTGGLLWVLAFNLKARRAEGFKSYAEELVRRQERWAEESA